MMLEKRAPLAQRLQSGAELLALIDRRREETNCPGFGSSIERMLIDRELRELAAASMPSGTTTSSWVWS